MPLMTCAFDTTAGRLPLLNPKSHHGETPALPPRRGLVVLHCCLIEDKQPNSLLQSKSSRTEEASGQQRDTANQSTHVCIHNDGSDRAK